jgi:hypothetical protein
MFAEMRLMSGFSNQLHCSTQVENGANPTYNTLGYQLCMLPKEVPPRQNVYSNFRG